MIKLRLVRPDITMIGPDKEVCEVASTANVTYGLAQLADEFVDEKTRVRVNAWLAVQKPEDLTDWNHFVRCGEKDPFYNPEYCLKHESGLVIDMHRFDMCRKACQFLAKYADRSNRTRWSSEGIDYVKEFWIKIDKEGTSDQAPNT